MPTCLRNVTLEFEYRTGSSNMVESFYIPCMRESVAYWRAVGYFTSQGLALAARGLFAFVAGGVLPRMFCCGCVKLSCLAPPP